MDVRRVLSNDECNNAIAHRPHLSNSPSITIPRSAAKSCHNSTGWIKDEQRAEASWFAFRPLTKECKMKMMPKKGYVPLRGDGLSDDGKQKSTGLGEG